MTDLDLFASAGDGLSPEHFGINEHGRVFVEAPAFARVLEYSSTQMALKQVDDAEWGYSDRLTPGGVQRMKVIYEDGIWELIFRSTLPSAKAIKARVKVILRQLRETGVVDTRQRPVAELPDRRALAQMVIEAEDRADVEKTRADVAEDALRKMRAAGGLNLRTFRKTHFPDVGEKVLLAHCYRKGYLIDQRPCWPDGERKRDSDGQLIYGPQHNHPGHAGLGWLKLEGTDVYGGKRRVETRVRPHTELDFVARLVQDGLPRYDRPQIVGAV